MSQPQILFRSSNYGVDQAYHQHRDSVPRGDRIGSFDQSSELMNKDKGDRRYVDLEDEDNVAMADQAAEGIDEFFIKFTFGSSLTNRF